MRSPSASFYIPDAQPGATGHAHRVPRDAARAHPLVGPEGEDIMRHPPRTRAAPSSRHDSWQAVKVSVSKTLFSFGLSVDGLEPLSELLPIFFFLLGTGSKGKFLTYVRTYTRNCQSFF